EVLDLKDVHAVPVRQAALVGVDAAVAPDDAHPLEVRPLDAEELNDQLLELIASTGVAVEDRQVGELGGHRMFVPFGAESIFAKSPRLGSVAKRLDLAAKKLFAN